MNQLLIFGRGYSGTAIAQAAAAAGFGVSATTRDGVDQRFASIRPNPAIQSATHLLTTAAPGRQRAIRFWTCISPPSHRRRTCAGSAICPAPWSTATEAAVGSTKIRPPHHRSRAGNAVWTPRTPGRGFAGRCAVDIFRLGRHLRTRTIGVGRPARRPGAADGQGRASVRAHSSGRHSARGCRGDAAGAGRPADACLTLSTMNRPKAPPW